MIKTSIITVNYNQPLVTVEFLKSVVANTNQNETEVILVDNGCDEDHSQLFKSIYPQLKYVSSPINLGFAGGNNLGVKIASGTFLLFLNNDTEITPDLLDVLTSELDSNIEIGIVSPLIAYFDDPKIIQYAGFTPMNYLTCRNEGIGNMVENVGQYDKESRETAYCHGAAMMCRRDDLSSVGLMEESYFLYYEELDWCEKFKKAGKKIWFTGKAVVFHKESISVGKESPIKTYFMTRNRMLFIRRNTDLLTTILFSLYYVPFVSAINITSYLLRGRIDLAKQVLAGVFWNFQNKKDSGVLGFKIK
ncbi:glycosyltransferase family 2 protein [Pedobacter sp. SAFR-022]|uniref:glycosyltransferase family 2 protein n=1 Tax=Pedobacter sp. SAFR-022 TaxID=3436861 RepID=UPI003F821658